MKKIKISELVTFVPGINPTRAGKQFGTQDIEYYDHSSFEEDYNHEDSFDPSNLHAAARGDSFLNEGDVVISSSLQLATMVGGRNAGKVLSLNFMKVQFNDDRLDRRYFLYIFNEYADIKRQKEREMQGSGTIQRIPIKALNQLIIPMIPIEEQHKIGRIYTETLKLQSKLTKYADLMGQLTAAILEKSLEEEQEDE